MKKACPVLNCPDSKVVHPEGECCPRCSGKIGKSDAISNFQLTRKKVAPVTPVSKEIITL